MLSGRAAAKLGLSLALACAALAFLARIDVDISRHQSLHVEAIPVAEAGVEEALHRLDLTDPTMIPVNVAFMNVAIRDSVSPHDPNCRARIFLCSPGSESAVPIGDCHACSIQKSADWLEFSSPDDAATPVAV
jgi:hypothetical protein